MHRRIDQLGQLLREMQDRYGSNDPVVSQLQTDLMQCGDGERRSSTLGLPFGERRSTGARPSYWNVPLRNGHPMHVRQDMFAECKRVTHRALGY